MHLRLCFVLHLQTEITQICQSALSCYYAELSESHVLGQITQHSLFACPKLKSFTIKRYLISIYITYTFFWSIPITYHQMSTSRQIVHACGLSQQQTIIIAHLYRFKLQDYIYSLLYHYMHIILRRKVYYFTCNSCLILPSTMF